MSCGNSRVQNFDPYKKYTPKQLQQDFKVLKGALEREHPSIYWYSTKHEMDSVFAVNKAKLKDSMTEFKFRQIVANVLSNIKCGHTSVRNTPEFEKWVANVDLSYFPYGMRLFADSMVSTYTLMRRDTLLPRGSVVKSINGKTAAQIKKDMYAVMSTDGDGDNFKNLRISNNFPYYFLSVYDSAKTYTIEYVDTFGQTKTVTSPHFKRFDFFAKSNILSTPDTAVSTPISTAPPRSTEITKEQKRERIRRYYYDSAHKLGILSLQSFSGGKQRIFYKKLFKKLKKDGVTDLAIDVRNNGGGLIGNSTTLAKYIADKPFKMSDSVYTNRRGSKYNRYIKRRFWYGLSTIFLTQKKRDGNYHFFSNTRKLRPKKRNHFNGQVYIITGGYSFSATTLFLNYTAHQSNVTTVGEPTGGSAYGNTAVYIPNMYLPNTKLKVRMPMFRLVMNKNATPGAPFYPEVYVGPTQHTLIYGNDNKIEKIWELIAAKRLGKK